MSHIEGSMIVQYIITITWRLSPVIFPLLHTRDPIIPFQITAAPPKVCKLSSTHKIRNSVPHSTADHLHLSMQTILYLIYSLLSFTFLASAYPSFDFGNPNAYETRLAKRGLFSLPKSHWPMACYGPEAYYCVKKCHCDMSAEVLCNEGHDNLAEEDAEYFTRSLTGMCGPICGCKRNGIWVRMKIHRDQWQYLRDMNNANGVAFDKATGVVTRKGRKSGMT
jgi:hypothetical protein